MITVELCRSKDGALTACSAKGHALYADKGTDIVCAAVTAVIRTTAAVLAADGRTVVTAQNPVRGELVFRIPEAGAQNKERLIYAADFLQKGLQMTARDYPEHVEIRVKTV